MLAVEVFFQPPRPKAADIAATGHGCKVIDVVQEIKAVQSLKQAEVERGAANAAARERKTDKILIAAADSRLARGPDNGVK